MKKIYVLCFVLLVSAAYSQTLTSDEIVNKYINAIGGTSELQKIKQISLTGKAVIMGHVTADINYYEDAVQKCMFSIVTGEGISAKNYYDMKSGWVSQNGVKDDVTPEQMNTLKITVEDGTYFYLANMESNGIKTELLGEEKIDGRDCYKIKFTHKGTDKNVQYIDKESFYAMRVESISSKGNLIVVNNSDYREVPGTKLILPYSIERGPLKGTVDKYEINVSLDPKIILGSN
ncbi:MAG: hypothetical protein J0M18_14855 [Ignavibacteria bacterium]|nr:hypothetical protein [Ignavibacteria bacterium]